MQLEQIRKKINKIDDEIVILLSQRRSFMPAVGRYKKENGMKIYQPKREQEILVSKKQQAKKLGLDVGLIQKIFKLILKDSRKIQNKYFKPSKQ